MKTLNDYTVVVAPNEGKFVAYIPAIRGCWAQATTPEAARCDLGDVLSLFMEVWEEYGETPPEDISAELMLAVG